jgi:hypothetical protein
MSGSNYRANTSHKTKLIDLKPTRNIPYKLMKFYQDANCIAFESGFKSNLNGDATILTNNKTLSNNLSAFSLNYSRQYSKLPETMRDVSLDMQIGNSIVSRDQGMADQS